MQKTETKSIEKPDRNGAVLERARRDPTCCSTRALYCFWCWSAWRRFSTGKSDAARPAPTAARGTTPTATDARSKWCKSAVHGNISMFPSLLYDKLCVTELQACLLRSIHLRGSFMHQPVTVVHPLEFVTEDILFIRGKIQK